MDPDQLTVRPIGDADRDWLRDQLVQEWGVPNVSISGVYDKPWTLDGAVAELDGGRVGEVTWIVDGDACEVLTLQALRPGIGVGRALMDRARGAALAARCHRLWLITSNENIRAIRFYQRWGMDIVALHRNFADTVRAAKPGVNTSGHDGIPFRHALELELLLEPQ